MALLTLVLAGFWCALVTSVREKSATADEPLHAAAGYSFQALGDYRLQMENSGNGSLPARWFALPLRDGFPFVSERSAAWQQANGFQVADDWFHRSGNDPSAMLRRGRAMAAVIATLLVALAWGGARVLYGRAAAWVALALCALNPGIVGNGPLMASDISAAFFFLAATWGWWAALQEATPARLVVSTLATAGLFLAKTSAPIVLPVFFVLGLARVGDGRPLAIACAGPQRSRAGIALAIFIVATVHAAVVYGAIWAAHGFRYACTPDAAAETRTIAGLWATLEKKSLVDAVDETPLGAASRARVREIVDDFCVSMDRSEEASSAAIAAIRQAVTPDERRDFDARLAEPELRSWSARSVQFARAHRLLPEAYLLGYFHLWHNSRGRVAFFNGDYSIFGWASYFPFLFAVKTPLGTLAIFALALLAWALRRRAARDGAWPGIYAALPCWVLAATYLAFAMSSRMNIGHRHLLPIYPPLFVLAGAMVADVAAPAGSRARRIFLWAAAGLLGGQALEMAYRWPHFLAYFNGIVAPAEAYRRISDSSIDWGQDLPGVRDYAARHPDAGPYYLSYFGAGDPATYGIKARILPSRPGLFVADRPPVLWHAVGAVTPATADEVRRRFPDYDFAGIDASGTSARVLLIKKTAAWEWTAGAYVIGATMLQSRWDARSEENYQALRRVVEPFLASDLETRRANVARAGAERWGDALASWERARFGRLAAFLAGRKPDDHIGFSMLVYRLSDAEIAAATTGPAPVRAGRR